MPDAVVYRDELPEGCPPDGTEIDGDGETVVYRFVEHDRVDPDTDFEPMRELRRHNDWASEAERRDAECRAWGVSVYSPLRKAKKSLRNQQNRERRRRAQLGIGDRRWLDMSICEVRLSRGAGAILLTSEKTGHHEWWPAADFDIRAHARLIREGGS